MTPAVPQRPLAPPTVAALRERHKAQRTNSPFDLRVHRSLSWLQRAQDTHGDDDIAFICLWVGFNAAYAQDLGRPGEGASERQSFRDFVGELCRCDTHQSLAALVWQVFPGPIRVLLNNQYLFQPFWDALNHPDAKDRIPHAWRTEFDEARTRVHRALSHADTERVLYEVLVRLYTLRNQLMHGGATWNSTVNRAQLRDGRALLNQLLPVMLGVMLDHPTHFAGQPFYPVVPNA